MRYRREVQGDPERRLGFGGMGKRAALAACLAGGFVLSPAGEGSAHAQTPSEIATAKRWFADGLVHEEKGEFTAALDLFRRAMEVKKTPQIVYHVGFCESRTGALVEALVDLDSAASIARAAHADDVVGAAQAELADVKKRIPSLEVDDEGGARATRFVVDGSAIALSMLRTAMPLDPGEHTVTVEYASGASTSKKVPLAEHEVRTLELTAQAETAATPAAASATTVPSAGSPVQPVVPDSAPHGSSAVPWTLVGVGGALVVGGAALFVVARSNLSSIVCAGPDHTGCDPSFESRYGSAKTLNALGIGLGAAGIVAAGVGVSMLVLRPSSTTSVAISPWGAVVRGRF